MAKRRFTFSALLPPYQAPRNEWRRRIHAAVLESQAGRGVGYSERDRLEVRLELFLGARPLAMADIEERVNDVLDALGGHIAGPRSRRRIAPIVPEADQIRRIVLEKSTRNLRGRPFGQLTLARYRRRRRGG
ncbi:MAG: hypothetical protein E6I40_02915 [Chloroflexi bacterium]|nr:MAG: hypothetical protein E6I40_02915 [Chloroflexota bacterium]TMF64991.1 MAG: hypothetical protein E6I20_06870 [Chloroflexota bacterium]TMG36441.1 MAG: hypothetical protein E6H94_07890 [Chloroflexota bacterium]TMG37101.1 MAG: hypothetical protein E6H88_07420 [Chloroflexota bacterium]